MVYADVPDCQVPVAPGNGRQNVQKTLRIIPAIESVQDILFYHKALKFVKFRLPVPENRITCKACLF